MIIIKSNKKKIQIIKMLNKYGKEERGTNKKIKKQSKNTLKVI